MLRESQECRQKSQNKSALGPNVIPYLLYKKYPRVLKVLHMLVESAWETGRVDNEWKRVEDVYILKEKDSQSLTQFRPSSLLNVEGKVFFTIMASRLTLVRDVQPIHWHVNPERGCARRAGVYWAHYRDLEINSANKEEPLQLTCHVAWPRERIWVSATSTPLENIGKPPCTNTRDQDHPRIFQRVWDEVLHDGV